MVSGHTHSSEGSRQECRTGITDITDHYNYRLLHDSSHRMLNKIQSCIHSIKIIIKALVYVIPIDRINNNSSRVGHVSLQQSFSTLSSFFQSGYSNCLPVAVICPIEIISNPVHCYAFYIIKICWGREDSNERAILYVYVLTSSISINNGQYTARIAKLGDSLESELYLLCLSELVFAESTLQQRAVIKLGY